MKSYSFLLPVLITSLIIVFILDLVTGTVLIPPMEVLQILLGQEPEKQSWATIITLFRLPKALAAIGAGAALSISGLMMQTLFRNPLAGPSVLGISSGASLGVALVVLGTAISQRGASLVDGLGIGGNITLVVASAAGSFIVLVAILICSRWVENVMTLLIVGLLGGFALNGVVSVLIHFSRPEVIQAYLTWTFGSFSTITWAEMWVFLPVCLFCCFLTFLTGKHLNVLLLGETYARSMGLSFLSIRIIVISITAILVGSVTAYCGPIGFIGIAVPHLARALVGSSDHRLLLPITGLIGSIVALFADIIAQLPGHTSILPLNAVTALIGSPVIIWFILGRQKKARSFV